jgi:hypothetical protein
MRKIFYILGLLSLTLIAISITPTFAQGPKTGDIWICPSVSTNNPHGMWVVGTHGAYYIIKPGTASPKWPDILNPTANLGLHAPHVEDQAQVTAGWGHYKDFPTYPYFEGDAMVLPEGAIWGLTPGIINSITADQEIPLASAVFW